ncbi:oligopeptide transport system ATP-binding protein [Rhodoglobus vestalii]|uniref:Oligopeptide transport system ATP-binding protein n=1 Tax=Rhodoglobus vestalii TaxID=193384 RepID=A0A8H2PX37_9MICO|nr:oligopeptide transport system ATP-binding protein [Rhodoglobus vestalii]
MKLLPSDSDIGSPKDSAQNMQDIVLSVNNLTIGYSSGQEVLRACRDVSFEVVSGETLGIVGESGSGKSSLLMALARLLPPNGEIVGGSVSLSGVGDLFELSSEQMRRVRGSTIGYVPQQPMSAFNPTMKVGRQVAEPLKIHNRLSYRESLPRVLQALNGMGLSDATRVANAFPHELSGGMLQRAMLAQATITNPRILLADEPTSALDVTVQRQIIELLKEVSLEHNLSTIIVSHDLEVVSRIADKILVMYGGRMEEHGPRDNVLQDPKHPYSHALLASRLTADQERKAPLPALTGFPLDLRGVDREAGCPFRSRCSRVIPICEVEFPRTTSGATEFACHNPMGSS